jgi:L-alanine-DL-glutamate epimerase-like enolase superfamily enzyme
MRAVELTIARLMLPLRRPYVLSFGTLHHFDAFIAIARFEDGSIGLGESCPLPGYSHETNELLAASYARLASERDLTAFYERHRSDPFVVSPVMTALEGPTTARVQGRVPICPILQWDRINEIPSQIAKLAAQGNKVAKVKLSADERETRETIEAVRSTSTDMSFRYDANQAFDFDLAAKTVRWLHHPSTQLLEQPFGIDAWDDMTKLHSISSIPLMLDESIFDADDVRRAANCAAFVKFKLMKNGSPKQVASLIRLAKSLGLEVILGNGVQGPIGCWLEGMTQAECGLAHAGEMNGYRKVKDDRLSLTLQDDGLAFELPQSVDVASLASKVLEQAEETWPSWRQVY